MEQALATASGSVTSRGLTSHTWPTLAFTSNHQIRFIFNPICLVSSFEAGYDDDAELTKSCDNIVTFVTSCDAEECDVSWCQSVFTISESWIRPGHYRLNIPGQHYSAGLVPLFCH